jgi:hypothetical protein
LTSKEFEWLCLDRFDGDPFSSAATVKQLQPAMHSLGDGQWSGREFSFFLGKKGDVTMFGRECRKIRRFGDCIDTRWLQ